MEDLFDTIMFQAQIRDRGIARSLKKKKPHVHQAERFTRGSRYDLDRLESYALEEAMGGDLFTGNNRQDPSWFDVDHALAARSTRSADGYEPDFEEALHNNAGLDDEESEEE